MIMTNYQLRKVTLLCKQYWVFHIVRDIRQLDSTANSKDTVLGREGDPGDWWSSFSELIYYGLVHCPVFHFEAYEQLRSPS